MTLPTPAHQLLQAALLSPAKIRSDALAAWLALPLGEPGLAADGDTDLTFALRHAKPEDDTFLVTLLERTPEAAWLRAADGEDSLAMAADGNHQALFEALLSHPQRPSSQQLHFQKAGSGFVPPLRHGRLPNALARLGRSTLLELWQTHVTEPLSPAVWDDAHPGVVPLLVRLGVPLLPSAVTAWRDRIRHAQGDLKTRDLEVLLQHIADPMDPATAVKDFAAVVKDGGSWKEPLSRIPQPDRFTVRRPGPDKAQTDWSLLGWAWWQTVGKAAENHHTFFHTEREFKACLSLLRGDGSLPLAPSLPIAPLLALVRPRLNLESWADLEAWSGQDQLTLLTQALPISVAWTQSPLHDTKRGKWLRRQWQELWSERVEQFARGVVHPELDRFFLRVMLEPALTPAFADEKGGVRWVKMPYKDPTTKQTSSMAWSDKTQAWWDAQPHALSVLACLAAAPDEGENTYFKTLVQASVRARLASGQRLAGTDAVTLEARRLLPAWAPDLHAFLRQETLAQRPAVPLPTRPRRRA